MILLEFIAAVAISIAVEIVAVIAVAAFVLAAAILADFIDWPRPR